MIRKMEPRGQSPQCLKFFGGSRRRQIKNALVLILVGSMILSQSGRLDAENKTGPPGGKDNSDVEVVCIEIPPPLPVSNPLSPQLGETAPTPQPPDTQPPDTQPQSSPTTPLIGPTSGEPSPSPDKPSPTTEPPSPAPAVTGTPTTTSKEPTTEPTAGEPQPSGGGDGGDKSQPQEPKKSSEETFPIDPDVEAAKKAISRKMGFRTAKDFEDYIKNIEKQKAQKVKEGGGWSSQAESVLKEMRELFKIMNEKDPEKAKKLIRDWNRGVLEKLYDKMTPLRIKVIRGIDPVELARKAIKVGRGKALQDLKDTIADFNRAKSEYENAKQIDENGGILLPEDLRIIVVE